MTPIPLRTARLFIAIALFAAHLGATALAWTPNAQEQDIANRLIHDSGQRRAFLQFDPILAQVARERAADMAKRHYFDHINPDGHGANYLVRKAGYVLPDGYPSDGNNIESIAAGGSTASVTWSDWMASSDHKTHLLGQDAFFAAQTSYGVGYYEDPSSQYRYYWVVITAPPMTQSATVDVVSPAEGASEPEGAVLASGTTSGAQAAAAVQVSVQNAGGSSAWTTVSGTQNWSTTLNNLAPGANTLHARSLNSSGGVLAETARTFQYVVLRPLTIHVAGQGNVGAFGGTTSRQVGTTYTITATPAAGWLFSGWSGAWGGAQATVSVQMREGLEETATFVPNPFLAWRGSYSGLIGASATDRNSRGLLRAQVDGLGTITGSFFFAGKSYILLSRFSPTGTATAHLAREGATPLIVHLDLSRGDGALDGTVADGSAIRDFSVGRARQTGAFLAALAGRYTVAFPAARSNADPNIPRGDGYGVLVVDANGGGRLGGVLADGATVLVAGWIADNGDFSLYQPLYSGRGELSGTLTFNNTSASDAAGTLVWQRPAAPTAPRFAKGFTSMMATVAARYTPPAAGLSPFADPTARPDLRLILGAGGLASEIVQPARFGATNLLTIMNPAVPGITAAINPATGFFAGTFTHPASGAVTLFHGFILQKPHVGAGFFLGSSQSGYVSLAPSP